MGLNDLKADFGQAYVRAVAHAAGYFVEESHRAFDSDGIDLTLLHRDSTGVTRSPKLYVQLKVTSQEKASDGLYIDIPVKNYEELRSENVQVPSILVAVFVPSNVEDWISTSQEQLIMKRCGYWKSLRGAPRTENDARVRITFASDYVFNVPQARELMERIRNGETP